MTRTPCRGNLVTHCFSTPAIARCCRIKPVDPILSSITLLIRDCPAGTSTTYGEGTSSVDGCFSCEAGACVHRRCVLNQEQQVPRDVSTELTQHICKGRAIGRTYCHPPARTKQFIYRHCHNATLQPLPETSSPTPTPPPRNIHRGFQARSAWKERSYARCVRPASTPGFARRNAFPVPSAPTDK